MQVLRINPSDTLAIRHKMLMPFLPLEKCYFAGDDDEQTFHLGAFVDKKLVSVASFYFESHPFFDDPFQFRLQGMATLPEYQGKGFSSALLKMAFPVIKQNLCTLVWCNAREEAIGYYQKVGFEKIGNAFEVPAMGTHYLMYKPINA